MDYIQKSIDNETNIIGNDQHSKKDKEKHFQSYRLDFKTRTLVLVRDNSSSENDIENKSEEEFTNIKEYLDRNFENKLSSSLKNPFSEFKNN